MGRRAIVTVFLWFLLPPLVSSTLVNVTISRVTGDEHSGPKPLYSPKAESGFGPSVSLKFNGTAIYVFRVPKSNTLKATAPSKYKLDSAVFPSNAIENGSVPPLHDPCVFSQTALPFREHTLVIEASSSDPSDSIFDYIIYSADDRYLSLNKPTTSDDCHLLVSPAISTQPAISSSHRRRLPRASLIRREDTRDSALDGRIWIIILSACGSVFALLVLVACICGCKRHGGTKKYKQHKIEPFVVGPSSKPEVLGLPGALTPPDSATHMLRRFSLETYSDRESMVAAAPTSVTPLSAEVEDIYGQLEVLSVQVESLHRRDSVVCHDELAARSEAEAASKGDAQAQEARQIRADVDHLRMVIIRLREMIPDSTTSTAQSAPMTSRNTSTNVTTTNSENGTSSIPDGASMTSLSPLELLRCLAMLRAEIDEYIGQMHLHDVNVERLPSYKSRRNSHMHLMGFRACPDEPLPPLPQPTGSRTPLRVMNADAPASRA